MRYSNENKQLINFIEFEGVGHTVTPKMLELTCNWYKNIHD